MITFTTESRSQKRQVKKTYGTISKLNDRSLLSEEQISEIRLVTEEEFEARHVIIDKFASEDRDSWAAAKFELKESPEIIS
jgi:hypothetical protein